MTDNRLTQNTRRRHTLQNRISGRMEQVTLAELQRLWRGVRRKVGRLHRLLKYTMYSQDMYTEFQDRLRERLLDVLRDGAMSLVELEIALQIMQEDIQPFEFLYADVLRELESGLAQRITFVTEQTKRLVARRVRKWFDTPGESMQTIINDLQPQFGIMRAHRIAQTEITRMNSSVQGVVANVLSIEEWWWQTRRDHLVCKQVLVGPDGNKYKGCRELHGMRFKIGMPMPPDGSHIGCRCDAVLIRKVEKLLKAQWEEGKHPRAKDGRFGTKSGGSGEVGAQEDKTPKATGKQGSKGSNIAQDRDSIVNMLANQYEAKPRVDQAGPLKKPVTWSPDITKAVNPHYQTCMRELSDFAQSMGIPRRQIDPIYQQANALHPDNRFNAYQHLLTNLRPEINKAMASKSVDKKEFERLQSKHRIAGLRIIAGLQLPPKPVVVKQPAPAPKAPKGKAKQPAPVAGKYVHKDGKTTQEINEHMSKQFSIPANYEELHVDIANPWNKQIVEHFNRFPELVGRFTRLGSSQGRYKAEKRELRERYLKDHKAMHDRMGMSQADRESAADGYAAKRATRTPRGAWAYSQSHVGVFMSGKDSPADLQKSLERSVRHQWHPVGCDTVKSVADHEMGHQLDDLLKIRRHPDVVKLFHSMSKSQIKTELSEYGAGKIHEFIAEAWSEYNNNPTPRPLAQKIGDIVLSEYASYKVRHP